MQPSRGRLHIQQQSISHLRRYAVVARLIDSKIPELWDAQLVYMNGTNIFLSGYNHIEDHTGLVCDYAQSWVISPAEDWPGPAMGTGYV